MQTMQQRISRLLAISAASFALSMGAINAAHAQDAAPANTAGAHHAGWHGAHGRHGGPGGFMRGLKKLHDKLNLNASQEKQYQAALDTAKQNREAMRANFRQFRQQLAALKQQPVIDMNALHDAHQRLAQQNRPLREQTEGAWLAFYNGLNGQQKATISDALKARFAKASQRRAQMHEHWRQKHAENKNSAAAPASDAQ
jgi:uncharacterized membrane protein